MINLQNIYKLFGAVLPASVDEFIAKNSDLDYIDLKQFYEVRNNVRAYELFKVDYAEYVELKAKPKAKPVSKVVKDETK